MRTCKFRQLIFGTALLLFACSLAWGQAFTSGSIVGTVADSSGAIIPRVSLTLTNLGTTAKLTTESDNTGLYQFLNLPPGNYRVDAEKSGFVHFVQEPVHVLVNSSGRIDITLQVGAVTEQVTVTAETPLLQPQTSSLGQVVETRMTTELPLNGRNPLALVSLVPGVVPQGSSGQNPVTLNPFAQGNIQINGGAANQSAAYWDGAPLNTHGYFNLLALVPTQDALQEFKVQTDNLPAQYDRFAGGIISFSTKSGTNKLHGYAYEFLRNKVLNANTFSNNAAVVPVGAFTQNQFGGNAGGPIVIPHLYNGKDKTFFFASYDGFRLRQGLPLVFSVPEMAWRNGDFSDLRDTNGNLVPIYDPATTRKDPVTGNYIRDQISCNGTLNVICPDKVDPTAKILANLWGPPNAPGRQFTHVNNWVGNASNGGDMNELTFRLDQNASDKQRIFSRYTINKYMNLEIDPFHTHAYPLQIGTPEDTTTQQIVFDDSYSFSPTTVLDVELAYLRNGYSRTPASTGFDLSTLGPGWAPLNNVVNYRTLPNLVVSQISDFGSQETGSTIRDKSDDWVLQPNVSMIRGRHTWKFGADLRLSRFNYSQVNSPSGIFNFGQDFTQAGPLTAVGGFGFASFMLGDASGGGVYFNPPVATQNIYRAFYAMDDFHATRKLTLNLGLRYSQDGPFSERFNRISTFLVDVPNPLIANTSLPAKGMLALVDTPQRPSRTGFDLDKHQFGPRLGFAYQFAPKTVFRGGYGVFWLPNSVSWFGMNPAVDPVNLYNTPMTTSIDGGLTPYNRLADPFPAGVQGAPGRNPIYQQLTLGTGLWNTQVSNNPYGYVQQWNLDVQQQLPASLFVDVAYAGSKGTHLPLVGGQLDQLPPQYLSMGNALFNSVANPYFGVITAGGLSGATVTAGQLLRPFPQFDGVQPVMNLGKSIYHSMQLKVQKPFTGGQNILVSYTVSKLISDVDSISGWLEPSGAPWGMQDWYNRKADRSVSNFDVPQRLVASYVLDVPVGRGKKFLGTATGPANKLVSGWGIQGITTIQRGMPLAMYAPNTSGSFGGGQRPNYDSSAAGCANNAALSGSAVSRLGHWFNTACFVQPPPFTFGNVGRILPNVRVDGLSNFDFALVKNTFFGAEDRMAVQFRAEFFNLFNHPQFGYPGTSVGSPSIGVVSSQQNTPRLVQFALKFTF